MNLKSKPQNHLICLCFLSLVSCQSNQSVKKAEDPFIRQRVYQPQSILVLPPLNDSANVNASDAFLSTITRPLAEQGYYVFPVAVVDQMMKANGLPTPADMHQASPIRLREVFGADSVLYIAIREWTTQYVVVNTSNKVEIEYLLVDLKTQTPIWQRKQRVVNSSGGVPTSLTGLAVVAAKATASALVSAATDQERKLASKANALAIGHRKYGLIKGPRLLPEQAEK